MLCCACACARSEDDGGDADTEEEEAGGSDAEDDDEGGSPAVTDSDDELPASGSGSDDDEEGGSGSEDEGSEGEARLQQHAAAAAAAVAEDPDPASDSSEDERPNRNTIGDVPLEWYQHEEHIGYDVDGKRLAKKPGGRKDLMDALIARADSTRVGVRAGSRAAGLGVQSSMRGCLRGAAFVLLLPAQNAPSTLDFYVVFAYRSLPARRSSPMLWQAASAAAVQDALKTSAASCPAAAAAPSQDFLRTVYDEYNDEEIVLSKEEMRMIQRIRSGACCTQRSGHRQPGGHGGPAAGLVGAGRSSLPFCSGWEGHFRPRHCLPCGGVRCAPSDAAPHASHLQPAHTAAAPSPATPPPEAPPPVTCPGQFPHVEVDPFEPEVDWFTRDVEVMPLSGAPEPKRRFIPSKWEEKK